jgi:phosphonoacetaldehyde hydrolase
MSKSVKAVIFDWAGTMIDFGCMAPVKAFISAFEEKNIHITLEEARESMGLAKRDHVKAILNGERVKNEWIKVHGSLPTESDIDEIYHIVTPKMMLEIENNSEPIEGVIEIIEELKSKGIKIGSTTGYIDIMMEKIVPVAAARGLIVDSAVNSSDCKEGRPSPFMIFRNMENLGIYDVNEVLKVGDTVADVGEGVNAGVWTASVVCSGNEIGLPQSTFNALSEDTKIELINAASEKLKNAGANFVIKSIYELSSVIEDINNKLNSQLKPKS